MSYILTGFVQQAEFRVFRFEHVEGRERTPVTVRANVNLIRKYSILAQELPLLCRRLLEETPEVEERRAFTYSEADMGRHAEEVSAKNSASKKYSSTNWPRKKTGGEPVSQGEWEPLTDVNPRFHGGSAATCRFWKHRCTRARHVRHGKPFPPRPHPDKLSIDSLSNWYKIPVWSARFNAWREKCAQREHVRKR